MPEPRPCGTCDGTGWVNHKTCHKCYGTGTAMRQVAPGDEADRAVVYDDQDDPHLMALVERSSLGTPGAKQLRTRGRQRRE